MFRKFAAMAAMNAITSLTVAGPALAQGQNRDAVVKTTKAAACPSGWRIPDGDTSRCEPMGTISPKIYAKTEKDSCASGYFEVHRLWCSTKRP